MARLKDLFSRTRILAFPPGIPVASTVAEEAFRTICPGASPAEGEGPTGPGVLRILPADPSLDEEGALLRLDSTGGGTLSSSRPCYLYGAFRFLLEEWLGEEEERFRPGVVLRPAFTEQRPLFDLFLCQYYRHARGWGREDLVRETARAGYTHLEVNGLAGEPAERGAPGEVLHRFYTYCPALDQFAESPLNRGTYPAAYLEANLARLEENASLARKYGLTPALLCFEPRSVPEALLQKYPTLRGCRVDHPFRSFRPRFNLSTAHPAVLDHYAALLRAIMKKVPDLGRLEIWSNDSGAAFEHTASLYAGRNGGAYLVREWRGHEEIARAAAGNILAFMKTLRDAGRRVNPDFRVILRIEPFETERPFLEEGLEEGLDLSGPSLLARGWDLPYSHPEYEDVKTVGGTLWHASFRREEAGRIDLLEKKGSSFHVLHAAGLFGNLEPLLGIPFPRLLWKKLEDLRAAGVERVGFLGGAVPTSLVPYPVTQEALRAFQAGGERDGDAFLGRLARRWAGEGGAERLVEAWRRVEDVLRVFPVPVHLYAIYGFVWYRLWARPLVPDIEAIPERERAYYEKVMLTTPHNPNRVDLGRDVLFELTARERAAKAVERMDREVFPRLGRALDFLEDGPGEGVFSDLLERTRALECWMETQRNTAAWIAGVGGWLEEEEEEKKAAARALVREAVIRERENTDRLLRLWRGRTVEFMVLSAGEENTFLYGGNFGEHLERRLALMEGREDDEPRVDPGFMWRIPDLEAWPGDPPPEE